MSTDIRRERSSSKRKGRDGPEDISLPRKKQSRKAADSDDEEDAQFENSASADEMSSKPSRKAKGKSAAREEKEYPSVNELKKRIRDVKRLLNKNNLPADARIVQERALAGYEEDLAEETARRERSSMISKYHFVRFLDRKTANKQLNRLLRHEKDDKLDSQRKKSLERKIHTARVNLNYTIYYPLTEKYISLYPKSKEKSSEEAAADSGSESDSKNKKHQSEGEKPALWSVVEKCMKDQTLDLLREGKMNIGADGKPVAKPIAKPTPAPTKKPVSGSAENKKVKKPTKQEEEEHEPKHASRRERRAELREKLRDERGHREHQRAQGKAYHAAAPTDGNESDGGFFE